MSKCESRTFDISSCAKLLLCNYLNILFQFHSTAQMTGTPWHVTPPAWSRGRRWRWQWRQTMSGYQSSSRWVETAAHRRIWLKHTARRRWKAAGSCQEWQTLKSWLFKLTDPNLAPFSVFLFSARIFFFFSISLVVMLYYYSLWQRGLSFFQLHVPLGKHWMWAGPSRK